MKSLLLLVLPIVCIFAANTGCKKENNTPSTGDTTLNTTDTPATTPQKKLWALYKDTLPGIYTWQHFRYLAHYGSPYSNIQLPDTTFPIIALDDSTLQVQGIRLPYQDSVFYTPIAGKLNDTANSIYYCNKYDMPWIDQHLIFYRKTDSIVFNNSPYIPLGGTSGDIYYTKIVH